MPEQAAASDSKVMTDTPQIILASASPRRRELLQQIGLHARVQAVDIDESRYPDEPVLAFVQRLAKEKAQAGASLIKNETGENEAGQNKAGLPVLGSDTVVETDGVILGKPEDRHHARVMLQMLSGTTHRVHTAVAVVCRDQVLIDTSSSEVRFKTLDDSEITAYVETGEADDKAGSYAIQGIAAQFIENIDGSFSGVMGLPIFETVRLLKQCGIDPLHSR